MSLVGQKAPVSKLASRVQCTAISRLFQSHAELRASANSGSRRPLFEHCVGMHEECFRDGDTEGLRGLEVHDQPEPRWALDR